jgi:peptide-methionine (R)-S-oxide reductase
MASRRQFFFVLGSALALGPVVAWLAGPDPAATSAGTFPFEKSDEAWRRQLTPAQYDVLRGHGTERAFSSPLDREKRAGTFVCAGCGQELFSSETKFDSGTGWPSFWQPLPGAVGTSIDRSFFMVRTEVHCARCGGHLGHIFDDGPEPTGLRYCINGAAMHFVPNGQADLTVRRNLVPRTL